MQVLNCITEASSARPLRILICGASGFIGRALCRHLTRCGHTVVRGVRQPERPEDVGIDYARDTDPGLWRERLEGIDMVVNAVGVITESRKVRFDDIHHRAPAALFAACVEAGVKRVIQISALGAECGETPYFRSKYAADRVLMSLPIEWQILRPSLVYGTDGISAAMFRTLASLPVIPVPGLGQARFQPIHIDDLVEGVDRAIHPSVPSGQQIDMVGSSPVAYPEMLDVYRRAMGFGRPLRLTVPAPVMACAAGLAAWIPGSALTPDTWRMLRAGNTADAAGITRLLGHAPKRIDQFIAPECAEVLRMRALAAWRAPLLRHALAWVWLVTAWVSAFVHPPAESLALLERVGLAGWLAETALYGASLLDFMMGIACIWYPCRALWAAQAGLVAVYSVVIAIAIPEFLSHPFGPVIKNLPILAGLLILSSESTSWTT